MWRFMLWVHVLRFAMHPAIAAAEIDRPNLTNKRIMTPFLANGHTVSLDGRVVVANVFEDLQSGTNHYHVRVFRPEALAYNATQGDPMFDAGAFSDGTILERHEGNNALSFCFDNPAHPYRMENEMAVYEPWVLNSRMFGRKLSKTHKYFRRAKMTIWVKSPFTVNADIEQVTMTSFDYITTRDGDKMVGIEPTMTADGRLLVFNGHNDKGSVLMYTYNPDSPCGATGWNPPRYLSELHLDDQIGLDKYPLSWEPLRTATSNVYQEDSVVLYGAYPWIDHEARNVLYTAALHKSGNTREAVSYLGADTRWTAVHIDGGINEGRDAIPKLFYSSPMWLFEKERHVSMTYPIGTSNSNVYLPVTKTHDVLPLFGSNTSDYNEIDLVHFNHDSHRIIYLPMNELVSQKQLILNDTPDLSGNSFTGELVGTAFITPNNTETQSGTLLEIQGRGKALRLDGSGAVRSQLVASSGNGNINKPLDGITIELLVKPTKSGNQGCLSTTRRTVLFLKGVLQVDWLGENSIQLKIKIGASWRLTESMDSLKLDAWTHIAWSVDGLDGTIRAYQNGVPYKQQATFSPAGTVTVLPGTLFIGGTNLTNTTDRCPVESGGFVGYLDEVSIYSKARSGRSICAHLVGANCDQKAILDYPTSSQYRLSNQDPGCTSGEALTSLACLRAGHRVCAQSVAAQALQESAATMAGNGATARTMVGEHPPVSMAGVPVATASGTATLACTPTKHQSLPLLFQELAAFHQGCVSDRNAASMQCLLAAHRFCSGIGWTTGMIFEATTRAWVTCFNSTIMTKEVHAKDLNGCWEEEWDSLECRISTSTWCQDQGRSGGIVQEIHDGFYPQVHCFDAPAVETFSF